MSTDARSPARSRLGLLGRGLALVLARLRFLLLVGAVLLLVGGWPTLRHYWERLTRPGPLPAAISSDTEYWCPMCPGVVSDWPSKCPVCHMTLVRRLKGEVTPLPDGVVARVQLSPYRVMLAGIHTTAIAHEPLRQDIIASGRLEAPAAGAGTQLVLVGRVFADEAPLLSVGQRAEISADDFPGERFGGRLEQIVPTGREAAVRVAVDEDGGRLRLGRYAEARFPVSAARLEAPQAAARERWRDQLALELAVGGRANPSGLGALLEAAVERVLLEHGLVLAVPESAIIDTGAHKVVFIESMPGMYDAVEVRLGRRCGEQYLVLGGLRPGQRVVTAGSVLLDAETRLNPSVAAGYFGAGARTPAQSGAAPAPGTLSPEDRLLAQRQKICPVTLKPLESMGGPVRVLVNGKPVFVCCDGCREPLLSDPGKYLTRLEKPK